MPLSTSSDGRTVRAMIGTARAFSLVAVMISAVTERSGRIPPGGSSIVITTSKSMAAAWPLPAEDEGGLIALLPISVTTPLKIWFGKASNSRRVLSPTLMYGTSVSSTSRTASTCESSLMVRTKLPALFMVPTMTVSPSSTLRRVTFPEI